MGQLVVQVVERRLSDAAAQQLILLATLDGATIDRLVHELPGRLGMERVAVGAELGIFLQASKPGRRSEDAEQWLRRRCRDLRDQPVLVTDIDLLFDPKLDPHGGLGLEPLTLLALAGRETPLRVVWPGRFDGTTLTYAVPEHAHFRQWTRPAAHVIDIDEDAAR